MKIFLFKYIIPPIGYILIYLINMTLRVRVENRDIEEKLVGEGSDLIYCFWHGRLFYFPYLYRRRPHYSILVSPSKDGEIIARILEAFGFSTVRGSSFKSGREAFWSLMTSLKKGKSAVLIGDGSRGPKYKIQKGVLYLAKKSGLSILPMTFSAKKKKVFSSWDSFILPYPFSEAVVIYGEPVLVGKDDDINKKSKELEETMVKITEKADGYF